MKIRKFSRILACIIICVFAFSMVSFAEPKEQSSEITASSPAETSESTEAETNVSEIESAVESTENGSEASTEASLPEKPVEDESETTMEALKAAPGNLAETMGEKGFENGEAKPLTVAEEPEESYLLICERKFLLDDPGETTMPAELREVEVKVDGNKVRGWKEINERSKNIILFYGGFEDIPSMGLYSYDMKEGTLQRYYGQPTEVAVSADEEAEEEEIIEIENSVSQKEPELKPEEKEEKEDTQEKEKKDQKPEVIFGEQGPDGAVAIQFHPKDDAKTAKLILEKNEESKKWQLKEEKSYSGFFGRILPYLIAAFVEILIFAGTLFLVKKLSK